MGVLRGEFVMTLRHLFCTTCRLRYVESVIAHHTGLAFVRLTIGFLYSDQGFIPFNLFNWVIVVVVVVVSVEGKIYIHVCITKKSESKR
jgi:hypothetical protein